MKIPVINIFLPFNFYSGILQVKINILFLVIIGEVGFQGSKCSNHNGVSTLAFTSDGNIVITVRSGESAQNANSLVPSGSGSADINDLKKQPKTFQTFIASTMERGLLEECCLNDVDVVIKTHIIEFAILLNRGGKPELFRVSSLNVRFDSLRVTRKEAMFIAKIRGASISREDIQEFKDSLDRFRRDNQDSFSFPLYLNILFLEDYINS